MDRNTGTENPEENCQLDGCCIPGEKGQKEHLDNTNTNPDRP